MINAATRLFRSRGYDGVGVAELLEVSGAPRGSLYFHFPGGKEQIAQEAVAQDAARVAALLARLRERSSGPDDYIDKAFTGWAKDMERSDFTNGCIVAIVAHELSARSPAMAQAANEAFGVWEAEIAKAALSWGMDGAQSARFATAALGAIEGAIILSRTRRTIAPFAQAGDSIKALAKEYLARG